MSEPCPYCGEPLDPTIDYERSASDGEVDPTLNLLARIGRLEAALAERDKLVQGYYNEAAEGWEKFRKAERALAKRDARIAELEKDARRYRWLCNRLTVRNEEAIDGTIRPALATRFGLAFFDSKPTSTTILKAGYDPTGGLEAAIDEAMSNE